ncbi:hypothetical protein ACC745_18650 [Rhizobium ruizarguesonis]
MTDKFDSANFVLEIVKTAVIVAGIAITISEFVIKDRAREIEIRRSTMDLIRADFGAEQLKSRMDGLQQIVDKASNGAVSKGDALILEKTLLPQFQMLVAWEVCMAADLCDEKIGKEYICTRARGYKETTDLTMKALGAGDSMVNSNYYNLLKRCGI